MRPSDNTEQKAFVIRIPWDSNTVRGFICALLIIIFFVVISPYIPVRPLVLSSHDTTSIPIEVITLLKFGKGNGPAPSHGNLTDAGKLAHATQNSPRFQDAAAPKQSTKLKSTSSSSTDIAVNIRTTKSENSKDEKNKSKATENSSNVKTNVSDHSTSVAQGDKKATTDGTGRGIQGTSSGAGLGMSLEWTNGGGNAVVLTKRMPTAPSGLNNSTVVKLRFTVDRNGDVVSVSPLTRGAPLAESAALRAMWLWKFKLKDEQRAEGIVKFTFDVN